MWTIGILNSISHNIWTIKICISNCANHRWMASLERCHFALCTNWAPTIEWYIVRNIMPMKNECVRKIPLSSLLRSSPNSFPRRVESKIQPRDMIQGSTLSDQPSVAITSIAIASFTPQYNAITCTFPQLTIRTCLHRRITLITHKDQLRGTICKRQS